MRRPSACIVGEREHIESREPETAPSRCPVLLLLLEIATHAITADVDRDRLGAASLAHLDRYMPI